LIRLKTRVEAATKRAETNFIAGFNALQLISLGVARKKFSPVGCCLAGR
jgi:hypothetical protein